MSVRTSTFKSLFSSEEIQSLESDYFSWLRNNPKVLSFLERLWRDNFGQYGFEHLVKYIFIIIRNSAGKPNQQIIDSIESVFSDKAFKKFTRFSRQANSHKMDLNYRLVHEYLNGIESFLDFGCGRMALIRRIVRENQSVKKFYGFDPKSQPYYLDFDPRVEFFDKLASLTALKNVDIVYSSFVFHHLTPDEIEKSIQTIHNLLKPGGTFILVEETYPINSYATNVDTTAGMISNFGYESHRLLLEAFETMNEKERMLVIYLNDVLINLKNLSYMPWTFEYSSMEEWGSTIESFGFVKQTKDLYWIIKEGKIKQGISGMMFFEKE